MIIDPFYTALLLAWFAIGAVTFVALLFVSAPYGRHSRPGWGPRIQSRFGWLAMEAASPLFFCLFLFLGEGPGRGSPGRADGVGLPVAVFAALWLIHYANRAFVYPFRMRGGRKPMALSIVLMAFVFNLVNGYINGRYLAVFGGLYGTSWFSDPRFIAGTSLFFAGFFINFHSDGILRRLRAPGARTHQGEGYAIPRGGFFNLVTSANYFGEVIEWAGWACLTWSIAGLAFAFWAACNLVPRARSHHLWYLSRFPEYPPKRKAILPFLY